MSAFQRSSQRVNVVLYEHWDPIGVRALNGPRDEYASYVPHLIALVHHGAPDHEVADYLAEAESESMGLPISERASRLAVAHRIRIAMDEIASAPHDV